MENLPGLIDYFCRAARLRIEQHVSMTCATTPTRRVIVSPKNCCREKFAELDTGIVQAKDRAPKTSAAETMLPE